MVPMEVTPRDLLRSIAVATMNSQSIKNLITRLQDSTKAISASEDVTSNLSATSTSVPVVQTEKETGPGMTTVQDLSPYSELAAAQLAIIVVGMMLGLRATYEVSNDM